MQNERERETKTYLTKKKMLSKRKKWNEIKGNEEEGC